MLPWGNTLSGGVLINEELRWGVAKLDWCEGLGAHRTQAVFQILILRPPMVLGKGSVVLTVTNI